MRAPVAGLVLVVAACGAGPRRAEQRVQNDGGDPPPIRADGSLAGPFARVLDAPELAAFGGEDGPPEISELGAAAGRLTVALREVRDSPNAATCVVTIETADGVFVGHGFLCSASRSDETVSIDEVAVSVDDAAATVRFRTSYARDGGVPEVAVHEMRCRLTAPLSCTPPPAIGGYE